MSPRSSRIARLFAWPPGLGSSADPILATNIDAEIENHILERVDKLVEEGLSLAEARREAERRFGDLRRVRRTLETIDQSMEGAVRRNEFLGSVFRDLQQGARQLRTAPGFAAAIILTIGLGVGANAAVFSVTDAVLLRPLPYDAPEELITIQAYYPEDDRSLDFMSPERALAWQREAPDVAALTLYSHNPFVMTGGEEAVSVPATAVSTNWLDTLGVAPMIGRGFSVDESMPGNGGVLIVSHEFWQQHLGADRAAVGRTVELNQRPYTVVGVMGSDFKFPPTGRDTAWVPMASDATAEGATLSRIRLLARPAEGAGSATLQERFDAVSAGLEQADPREDGWAVRLAAFDRFRANADVEQALWVLSGAVVVMLLIATINAANLLLLRAASKRSEVSVRMALGASRGRLIRQHITENLVLVGAGGVAAVALARLVIGSIVGLLPGEVTFFLTSRVAVNNRVLLFSLVVTAFTGLALSLVPALRATSAAHQQSTGSWSAVTPSGKWLRNSLVVAEVAMTVTLLVGAGLLINSFVRLTSVDPGYNPANTVQLTLLLQDTSYPDGSVRAQFLHQLRDELQALPGVQAASIIDGSLPGGGTITFGTPQAEGGDPKEIPGLFISSAEVEPTFFQTFQIPLVAGRNFDIDDTPQSGNVIVDRDMARFLWGSENPIGRRFRLNPNQPDDPWLTVVGLVGDVKLMGQDDREATLDFFRPLPRESVGNYMSIAMRTSIDPVEAMPAIRAAVRRLDPNLPLYRLATGEMMMAESVDKPRFFLLMMMNFAAIALGLAVIGTYGVMAFAVRRRQRELGVRIALGADSAGLQRMVLREGLTIAAIGVLLGLGGALALGQLAAGLLFQLEPTDPLTFAGVAGVMLGCAAIACWVPARRATRVDPVEVLRAE